MKEDGRQTKICESSYICRRRRIKQDLMEVFERFQRYHNVIIVIWAMLSDANKWIDGWISRAVETGCKNLGFTVFLQKT